MNTRARTFLAVAALAAAAATGCSPAAPTEVAIEAAAPSGTVSLSDVAAGCAAAVDDDGIGTFDVDGELRASNEQVTFEVPCLVSLAADAQVTLNEVDVDGATVNIDDVDADPGTNVVRLHDVTMAGHDGAGLLVRLSDADDEVHVISSVINYPSGIRVLVAGSRDGDNSGGAIRTVASELVSTGDGSAGVMLASSEHDGTARFVETIIDTPGTLVISAADCTVVRDDVEADCSSDSVTDSLAEQLEQVHAD